MLAQMMLYTVFLHCGGGMLKVGIDYIYSKQ